ncbi:MAG: hypothetical protein VB108_04920 [Anaerolineaceae bacterium]|nr:hypothetical protein [Anaerolineaceae bacterium]
MSNFPAWFNRAYKQWSQSQAGEEDFIAFCDLLGYPPSKVLGWLHGEFLPEGPDILSIAGTVGTEVYSILGLPEVDPELMKIYHAFSHLHGEFRSRLAQALWEAQNEIEQKNILNDSEEAKAIFNDAFTRWGMT